MLSQRARKYQIITLTFVFITVYRLGLVSMLFLINPEAFVQAFRFDIWVFLVAFPLVYFSGWLLVTWVASKHSVFSLKEKFYRHPIAPIKPSHILIAMNWKENISNPQAIQIMVPIIIPIVFI